MKLKLHKGEFHSEIILEIPPFGLVGCGWRDACNDTRINTIITEARDPQSIFTYLFWHEPCPQQAIIKGRAGRQGERNLWQGCECSQL
jgi:hypothetical protein